ncbi:hypothetical protein PROFUN_04126 [Planoprotostelium fungivorum]|uniref:Uncharacterized protein n=1 Tax=Planoprotostelium fungivorum TaxID=1890364 RepID=A0A2P6NJJ3_9EUKA|nr:hypothetical protein PROFUN_04126 [Planoprotostelium fungivorum]
MTTPNTRIVYKGTHPLLSPSSINRDGNTSVNGRMSTTKSVKTIIMTLRDRRDFLQHECLNDV